MPKITNTTIITKMTELQTIEQQIQSEITISTDGRGFITGRGLSRLLGVTPKAIRESVKTEGEEKGGKIAQILTGLGFEAGNCPPYPDIALIAIATYYGYESKVKSEQARKVVNVLGAMGARQWMQTVTGWKAPEKMTKVPAQQLITLAQAALEHGRMTEYAEDYPGLQNILDQGRQANPLIDGMMTVEQALLSKGFVPTNSMKRAVGGYVAIQWRQYKWAAPEKASTAKGQVSAYPASFLVPCIENALQALT